MVWSQVAKGEAEIKMAINKVNKRHQRDETTWYCSYVAVECGKLPLRAETEANNCVQKVSDVHIFVVTDYICTDSTGKLWRTQTELRNIINAENYLTSLTNRQRQRKNL
jgi:hypothetical protein